jgi:hypothetical protein
MLKEKEQRVLQVVQMGGPKLPTEVSKTVGMDTYITAAILSSLAKAGHLHNTSRKIGSSLIYYVDGQEDVVRKRLLSELNDIEKKALERIKGMRVAFEDELYPQERYLMNDLKDFVVQVKVRTDDGQEINCWRYYEVPEEEMRELVKRRLAPKAEVQVKRELKLFDGPKTKRGPKESSSVFSKNIEDYIGNIGAETIANIRTKASEVVKVVKVQTIVGSQTFMLYALNKRSVTESDLSRIYVESSKEKRPVLLITTNELGKKAQAFAAKHFGDLLKIVKI